MRYFLILTLTYSCWISCNLQAKPSLDFIPLDKFTSDDVVKIDSNKSFHDRVEYCLVENYSAQDTATLKREINSMLKSKMFKDYKARDHYTIMFYKTSDKTNRETARGNKHIFDFFPNDDFAMRISFLCRE